MDRVGDPAVRPDHVEDLQARDLANAKAGAERQQDLQAIGFGRPAPAIDVGHECPELLVIERLRPATRAGGPDTHKAQGRRRGDHGERAEGDLSVKHRAPPAERGRIAADAGAPDETAEPDEHRIHGASSRLSRFHTASRSASGFAVTKCGDR